MISAHLKTIPEGVEDDENVEEMDFEAADGGGNEWD